MEIANALDAVLGRAVLVFGSIPPQARDLDLLARQPEKAAIEDRLRELGFERSGAEWARFANGTAQGVDVVFAEEWGLPPTEARALFEESIALDGCKNLSRPGPHHAALILARRVVRSGHLDEKRRKRLDAAIAEEPRLWERATHRAPLWGAHRALVLLRNTYERGGRLPHVDRIAALREEFQARDGHTVKSTARAVKRTVGSKPAGHVVTFSGLDGSGKSTQAENLRDALNNLGYDAVIEWTKIARNPSLNMIAKPFKALLRARKKSAPAAPATLKTGDGVIVLDPADAAAKDLRKKSPFITGVWTSLVAITNASGHRRATREHTRAGRIVICDRYTLDTAAHLRYRYGTERRFRGQARLNRLLSTKPLKSYFLDVSPEAAYGRKAEQYDVGELELLRRLYLEEAEAASVEVIDGERPLDEISAHVAHDVWKALTR